MMNVDEIITELQEDITDAKQTESVYVLVNMITVEKLIELLNRVKVVAK